MTKTLNDVTPAEWDVASRFFSSDKVFGGVKDVVTDLVNKPPHYNQGGMECIDYIKQQQTPEEHRGYLEGNSLKYMHRHKYKGGVQDLEKALWYLERLKEAQND